MDIGKKIETFILTELFSGGSDEEISPSEDLISTGILDSLALMDLVSFLDSSLNIKVAPNEISAENFRTLDSIKFFVEGKLGSIAN